MLAWVVEDRFSALDAAAWVKTCQEVATAREERQMRRQAELERDNERAKVRDLERQLAAKNTLPEGDPGASSDGPRPVHVPAPTPSIQPVAADSAGALQALVGAGYDKTMAAYLEAELASGMYRKTTANSDHLMPRVYSGDTLVYEVGEFIQMIQMHSGDTKESGGVVHFMAESLFGPRAGKRGFVPFTHMTELEQKDKVAIAFEVQNLTGPDLTPWVKAAKHFARRGAPAPGGHHGGGAGHHGGGAGHHGARGELAQPKLDFLKWAVDSGQMPEHEARQLLDQAIREGQRPPFDSVRALVREKRSVKLQQEKIAQAQVPAPSHRMGGAGASGGTAAPRAEHVTPAPSHRMGGAGASGGTAAPRAEHVTLEVIGYVGRRGEATGPGGFLPLMDAGVCLGHVKIPTTAFANERIEVHLLFARQGDHISRKPEVVLMRLISETLAVDVPGPHVVLT